MPWCFGAYFAAFYRGEDSEQVVAMLWPGIAARS